MRSRSRILRDSYSKNLMAAREPSGSALFEPGELPQQLIQRRALDGRERCEKRRCGLARLALKHLPLALALGGQMDGPAPAVAGGEPAGTEEGRGREKGG